MHQFAWILLFISGIAFGADITSQPMLDNSGGYSVAIVGEIRVGDSQKLRELIKARNAFPHHIFVESPGGDALESMQIGRLVRRSLVPTYPSLPCNSGCALIVVASVKHDSEGKIGIHRPYYDKKYFADLSLDRAEAKYKELDQRVSRYLREMSVPTMIAEKMMTIPSSSIEILPMKEYVRLAGESPAAYDEWLIAQCGALTQEQRADVELLIAKSKYEVFNRMGSSAANEFREQAELAARLPAGYIDLLSNRSKEIEKCRKRAVTKEQDALLPSLTKR